MRQTQLDMVIKQIGELEDIVQTVLLSWVLVEEYWPSAYEKPLAPFVIDNFLI